MLRALKVSYIDVCEGGVAVNCEKTQFFNTLYNLPVAVVVLVHSLQPAHVVVGVGHQVDVDEAGLGGGTGGVAAFSRHLRW